MCQESKFINSHNLCGCETGINDDLLGKKELLNRLKEHKKNLESELHAVNKNLESTAIAAEGGE